jgi:hypothetical protein
LPFKSTKAGIAKEPKKPHQDYMVETDSFGLILLLSEVVTLTPTPQSKWSSLMRGHVVTQCRGKKLTVFNHGRI